jgi:hypothetical protein
MTDAVLFNNIDNDSGHFGNDDGAFPLSSLALALANATANERDRRQRKALVENIVCYLVDTLDPNAETSGAGTQNTDLVEQILKEDTGSTTIAMSLSSATPAKKITWNRNQPLILHWVWQEFKDDEGSVLHSTCNVSILAKEGVTIEFGAPPTTTASADPQQSQELQKIVVCDVSNFQWTLEGRTKKTSDNDERSDDIQSFWKLESANLSWTMGSFDEVVAEEVLMEGTDISLIGNIVAIHSMEEEIDKSESKNKRPSLRLQSKSVLSLKVSAVGSLGGSDEEKRRVGLALRTMVAYLDNIVFVPNLHLSLTELSKDGEIAPPIGNADGSDIPSFEEAGDSMSLGDAMKYYLKYYCSGSNNTGVSRNLASKFLSMSDSITTFGALAATGTSFISPIGAAVSVAALAAKDGVEAAARRGKQIREEQSTMEEASSASGGGNELTNRISLEFVAEQSSSPTRSPAAAAAAAANEGRYKFGDVTRGIVGSIREKRQEQQRKQNQASSAPSEGDGDGTYFQQNKARFAGVAGSTAGAAAGLLISGSYFGSMGSQRAVQKQEQQQQQSTNRGEAGGFRFGDNFRKVVATGREKTEGLGDNIRKAVATGREKTEGYRFGDFSRGLLTKVKGQGPPNIDQGNSGPDS